MGILKPYYRIARPKADIDYVKDERYATDRLQLSRVYISIEKELREIFDYIEPDEKNKDVFSLKLSSLLFRACSEVELNCKKILESNDAVPERYYFTMEDYKKLEHSSKLSRYKVLYKNWRTLDSNGNLQYEDKVLEPFKSFGENPSHKPLWYTAYNDIKHNREINLHKATLENCMNAVAGILILLYSQFCSYCIETYGTNGIQWNANEKYESDLDANIIFEIKVPEIGTWDEAELYSFNWNELKTENNPFDKFIF